MLTRGFLIYPERKIPTGRAASHRRHHRNKQSPRAGRQQCCICNSRLLHVDTSIGTRSLLLLLGSMRLLPRNIIFFVLLLLSTRIVLVSVGALVFSTRAFFGEASDPPVDVVALGVGDLLP